MSTYPLNFGWDDASDQPDTSTQVAQAPSHGLDNELKAVELDSDTWYPIGELPNHSQRKGKPSRIWWKLAKPSPKGGFTRQSRSIETGNPMKIRTTTIGR